MYAIPRSVGTAGSASTVLCTDFSTNTPVACSRATISCVCARAETSVVEPKPRTTS